MPSNPVRPGQYDTADDLASEALAEVEQEVGAPATSAKPAASTRPLQSDTPTPGAVKPPPGEKAPDDERTPAERWADNLRAAKLTEADANAILDAVLARGHYAREYKIFHGRLTATLRTRDGYALNRVAGAVDRLRNPVEAVVQQTVFHLNLAGSIVRFKPAGKPDVALPHPSPNEQADVIEKAFLERLAFVDGLAGPVLNQLYQCLAHFDMIVAAATSEGAAENF